MKSPETMLWQIFPTSRPEPFEPTKALISFDKSKFLRAKVLDEKNRVLTASDPHPSPFQHAKEKHRFGTFLQVSVSKTDIKHFEINIIAYKPSL